MKTCFTTDQSILGPTALAFSFALVIATGSLAVAGDKIGNGGAIWACENAAGEFQSGLLFDLFEGETEFGIPEMKSPLQDPYAISKNLMAKFQTEWPEFAQHVQPHMDAVVANTRFVDAIIQKIDDAKEHIAPLKNLCHGTWSYLQIANYKLDGQLLIRRDIWEHPGLGALDKAALLWHEAIYRWLRTDYQDETSTRTRKIVGLVFSTLPTEKISLEVRKELWQNRPTPPPHPPVSWPPWPPMPNENENYICVMDETMHNTVYMQMAANQNEAKNQVQMSCKNGPNGHFCSDISLACEMQMPDIHWECTSNNRLSGHMFLGKGRSRLEGQYRAQAACISENPAQAIHCTQREMMECSNI